MFLLFAKEAKQFVYNILETKNALKCIKTISEKNRKIGIFLKGLVHGFGQNCEIWLFFFFRKISEKNVFDNILET